MHSANFPDSPIAALRTIELSVDRAPLLQRFFDENPAYFLATSGERAGPNEAFEEITSEIPSGWGFNRKLVVGYTDENGSLVVLANLITDLLAEGIFHIGTFIVATPRHGSGIAQVLYQGLESWSVANGASYMRLGVVQGNLRAERFWASLGYAPIRQRHGVPMGKRLVTVQTMVKLLNDASLGEYLARVPRDQPESRDSP